MSDMQLRVVYVNGYYHVQQYVVPSSHATPTVPNHNGLFENGEWVNILIPFHSKYDAIDELIRYERKNTVEVVYRNHAAQQLNG